MMEEVEITLSMLSMSKLLLVCFFSDLLRQDHFTAKVAKDVMANKFFNVFPSFCHLTSQFLFHCEG